MLLDIGIIFLATFIAYALRFDFNIPDIYHNSLYVTVLILVSVRIFLFNFFRIYDISWRHFGFKDTTGLIYVTIFSTLVLVVVAYFLGNTAYTIPRSVIPIEFFISLFMILALRVSKRLYLENHKKNIDGKSTIIIASADNANTILHTINNQESEYYPVAIINEDYQNRKVNGVSVYSIETFSSLKIECEVAILDTNVDIGPLYNKLQGLGITNIKVAKDYGDYGADIQNISVEDLLARKPQDLDTHKIAEFIKGQVILVTGAGGSIGSEICRQCEIFGAKKLILLDNSEYNLYTITEEIKAVKSVSIMQSVVNKEQLKKTFSLYKPDIVIHAAAYKHVPLVEENIHEAIINNVIGTKNIIDTAIENGVKKLVLISTDKAVRPTNVMGTTKRICELYAQNANGQGTDIVAVRFGNVLGSSGSVIPKFKAQIEAGQNITVTHPEITRYFMLIPEACALVLQAGAIGSGGEIFILDMGEPTKIVDLAKKMIELSGNKSIGIEFIGLRPGEKLYEELLIDDTDYSTVYSSITVAKPTYYNLNQLNRDIEKLLDNSDIIAELKKIVPEFEHKLN